MNKTETITVENCTACNTGIEFSYNDLMALDNSNVIVTDGDIYYHGDIKCPFCGYYESIMGEIMGE